MSMAVGYRSPLLVRVFAVCALLAAAPSAWLAPVHASTPDKPGYELQSNCQACRRLPDGRRRCSNIGIACQPRARQVPAILRSRLLVRNDEAKNRRRALKEREEGYAS